MASGLVPTTSLTSAKRSLPPSSAGGVCLHYGLSSSLAKIVSVGLKLEPDWWRRHDMVGEAMLVAIGDRRVFRREGHPHLWIGVARSVPAGQRVGPERLLPFKLQKPAPGVRLARLRGLAFDL